jgi:LPS sulfotransferase NodH
LRTALALLFESEAADRLLAFFRARGEQACIIAPAWVRERAMTNIPEDQPGPRALWSETPLLPESTLTAARNFFVVAEDAAKERSALAALSPPKGTKAFGLFANILPALLCGVKYPGKGQRIRNLKRYAVLCIPRSGSGYLATMLTKSGLGAPLEHLRDPLAVAIVEGKLGFGTAIESLERYSHHNLIFGTKLISTFLIKASGGNLKTLQSNMAWMVDRGYQFVHLDRPLNDAVVSSYIAFRMNKWHYFGQMDASTRTSMNNLAFDERAVWDEYIRFRAQKAVTDHLRDSFGFPSFPYATIEHSVETIIDSLCQRLDVDPKGLEPGTANVPLATRAESPIYERFAADLNRLLDRRKDEILQNTVRTLSALVGIKPGAAQILARS